jgi:predicted RNase H-like nuclease (RuvC/YqgF family)
MADIPASLRESLERTKADPEPLSALGSSRQLFREISAWQTKLVAKAVGTGASWEEVGAALGTTRQAAWARFRSVAESDQEGPTFRPREVAAMKERVNQEVRSLQQKLKEFDEKWRARQAELRERARNLERERATERKQLQHEIRATTSELRDEIRRLREPIS